MLREYPKIEAIFKRDMNGSKKLLWGEYCNETVEALKDCQWELTEKIDGTNVRIYWDGHSVLFHGRTDKSALPSEVIIFLEETFGGEVNEEIFEQKFGDKEVTLFGEGYGPKIQKVGAQYRQDTSFILFDVLIGDIWLKRDAIEDIAKAFGIDTVPFVGYGTLEDGVNMVLGEPVTRIPGGTCKIEGIVARAPMGVLDRQGKRVLVKIKVNDLRKAIR